MAGKTFTQLAHQVAKKNTTASDPSPGAASGGPVTATSPGTPLADGAGSFRGSSPPPTEAVAPPDLLPLLLLLAEASPWPSRIFVADSSSLSKNRAFRAYT